MRAVWRLCCRVGGGSEKKKRGSRRLVIIRGRDGAATVSHERFRTPHDGGVSCSSCVMMVMVMAVDCGGNGCAIDDGGACIYTPALADGAPSPGL